MTPPYHPPCLRTQRSRRGLARTTSSLHRNTGARIALLYTVSRLACSYVILNGTLAKVRRQYCAESGCSTLTSRDINEFHEFVHRFVLRVYAERTMSGRIWVFCIRTMYSGHRSDTSRHQIMSPMQPKILAAFPQTRSRRSGGTRAGPQTLISPRFHSVL